MSVQVLVGTIPCREARGLSFLLAIIASLNYLAALDGGEGHLAIRLLSGLVWTVPAIS